MDPLEGAVAVEQDSLLDRPWHVTRPILAMSRANSNAFSDDGSPVNASRSVKRDECSLSRTNSVFSDCSTASNPGTPTTRPPNEKSPLASCSDSSRSKGSRLNKKGYAQHDHPTSDTPASASTSTGASCGTPVQDSHDFGHSESNTPLSSTSMKANLDLLKLVKSAGPGSPLSCISTEISEEAVRSVKKNRKMAKEKLAARTVDRQTSRTNSAPVRLHNESLDSPICVNDSLATSGDDCRDAAARANIAQAVKLQDTHTPGLSKEASIASAEATCLPNRDFAERHEPCAKSVAPASADQADPEDPQLAGDARSNVRVFRSSSLDDMSKGHSLKSMQWEEQTKPIADVGRRNSAADVGRRNSADYRRNTSPNRGCQGPVLQRIISGIEQDVLECLDSTMQLKQDDYPVPAKALTEAPDAEETLFSQSKGMQSCSRAKSDWDAVMRASDALVKRVNSASQGSKLEALAGTSMDSMMVRFGNGTLRNKNSPRHRISESAAEDRISSRNVQPFRRTSGFACVESESMTTAGEPAKHIAADARTRAMERLANARAALTRSNNQMTEVLCPSSLPDTSHSRPDKASSGNERKTTPASSPEAPLTPEVSSERFGLPHPIQNDNADDGTPAGSTSKTLSTAKKITLIHLKAMWLEMDDALRASDLQVEQEELEADMVKIQAQMLQICPSMRVEQ